QAVDPCIGWCLTYPINFSGNPAASVPAGFDDAGLPVGLQIVGRRHDDATVLAASRGFEQSRPWAAAYRNLAKTLDAGRPQGFAQETGRTSSKLRGESFPHGR
ncbi:MAG TPA: amidase family protein, partial [Opitutus sp.]|nr:amidase family protein [Opitutus sp.]